MARAAGRFARKWLPHARQSAKVLKAVGPNRKETAKEWAPTARQSGLFVKHVLPAAAKPIHSLWHEILGFVFLVLAGLVAFKIWQHPGAVAPLGTGSRSILRTRNGWLRSLFHSAKHGEFPAPENGQRRRTRRSGYFPWTRGIYPEMYRSRLWTMRQYAGFGSAEESNARYRYLLSQGTTGLSVAFDLPTQIGLDPDHPLAEGEVGRVGVSIASLATCGGCFEGIRFDEVSTSMTINSTAAILLAYYVLVAREQGADCREAERDGSERHPEGIRRARYVYLPAPPCACGSLRICLPGPPHEIPEWNTISISGYHIREAGSTAEQEVAFTFANAIAYIEAAIAAGLAIDSFAPRLSFFFNSHSDFLTEIAKFRAARRLYARLMRNALRR